MRQKSTRQERSFRRAILAAIGGVVLTWVQPLSWRQGCRMFLYALRYHSCRQRTATHRLDSRPSSRMMRIHANGQR